MATLATYHSRIPKDDEYASAIGIAMYNFMYMEWTVIWIIFKISTDGTDFKFSNLSSGHLHKELVKSIRNTAPPLTKTLRARLRKFAAHYASAIKLRNSLVHGHPCTTEQGDQRLNYRNNILEANDIIAMAFEFENAAIEGGDIFHGDLKRERP